MDQILPHKLWIGTVGDLRDWRHLYDLGICAVVQLAYEEFAAALPRDIVACRFPILDGADNTPETLDLAISTLTQLLQKKFATLVCCQAGLSRSPAIVAAALARLTGQSLSACLSLVAACHLCEIHPGLLTQIQTMCSGQT